MIISETTSGIQNQPRCLILGHGEAVRKLEQVLATEYKNTLVVESFNKIQQLAPCFSLDLLVVTDQLNEFCPPARIKQIKTRLKPRAIVGVFNKLTSNQEIALRSIGMVFLGNHETFMFNHRSILASCSHSMGNTGSHALIAAEPDRDSRTIMAREAEERMSRKSNRLYSQMRKSSFIALFSLWRGLNRIIELAVGISVSLSLLLPLLFPFYLRKLITASPIFSLTEIVGAGGNRVLIRRFNTKISFLQKIPLFMELLTGRLALVGPSMTDWRSRPTIPAEGYIRMLHPGIFSLWQIRQASRTTHGGQEAIDWEYVFKKRPLYDFLLLLKIFPALIYRQDLNHASETLNLFGLDIANIDMKTAVSRIETSIAEKKKKSVFFVNPDCLNKMSSDREYFRILKNASLIFPDGIGLTVAGKLLNTPLKENINGTDMFPYLCRMASSRDYSLFLLGGKPGIAEKTAQNIESTYKVRIAGTSHGYFDNADQHNSVIEQINRSGAEILLVGFGAPSQEKWITAHMHRLNPSILMGVGGLFDFFSGNINRAPVWMREVGLEWVYRILQEPGRMWRRYVIGNPLFISRVIRWKFMEKGNNPASGLDG